MLMLLAGGGLFTPFTGNLGESVNSAGNPIIFGLCRHWTNRQTIEGQPNYSVGSFWQSIVCPNYPNDPFSWSAVWAKLTIYSWAKKKSTSPMILPGWSGGFPHRDWCSKKSAMGGLIHVYLYCTCIFIYIYIIIYNTVLYVYIYIVDMTWYDWYRNMLPQKWSGIQNRKPASGVNWPLTYYMIHAADIYLTRWPLKKRSELCMCLQCSIQIRRGFLYYGTIWYPIAGW